MAFDLDEDELKATREMHKLSDKNVAKIDDDINKLNKFCEYEDAVVLCEEALYEIQEAIERILSEREQDKARIKELEEENYVQKVALLENSIPKQKVKEILIEIQEEYNKLDKEIDKQIKDKNKDYYKCKENIAIMQRLAYCRDKFEGLLEEK